MATTKEKEKAPDVALHGVIICFEDNLRVIYTPLGDGGWRIENQAYEQVAEDLTEIEGTPSGKWLLLDGLIFDQIGLPLFDGEPLPPRLVDRVDEVA